MCCDFRGQNGGFKIHKDANLIESAERRKIPGAGKAPVVSRAGRTVLPKTLSADECTIARIAVVVFFFTPAGLIFIVTVIGLPVVTAIVDVTIAGVVRFVLVLPVYSGVCHMLGDLVSKISPGHEMQEST